MPDINNISVPRYQPSQPYHYVYDNLPIDALVAREDLINTAVDANTAAIAATYGTAGSLAGRLDQSLELNGDLKTAAVDTSLHNIGAHTDGSFTVDSGELSAYQADYPLVTNPVPFVRIRFNYHNLDINRWTSCKSRCCIKFGKCSPTL